MRRFRDETELRDEIYRSLPAHIRVRDHEVGQPLRALMRAFGRELEIVEDDMDVLYENWFIETCEDWVIPYLGDLIGVRPLRPFGTGGGLRAHVANTLYLRSAKGTLAGLEQAARDVTGWPTHAVEFYTRLVQSQHLNHLRLGCRATVSLRDADAAARTGGPFEIATHNVGVRSVEKGLGRYNIPNVGLFVWRVQSYSLGQPLRPAGENPVGYVGGTTPRPHRDRAGQYNLDPVGRDIRLFNRPQTAASVEELSSERNLPHRLRRQPLARDLASSEGRPAPLEYFGDRPVFTARLAGADVPVAKLHCCNLEDVNGSWRRPSTAGEVMFDPELGRLSVHPDDEQKSLEVTYAYGAPHDVGGGPYDRRELFEELEGALGPARTGMFQIGVTRRSEEIAGADRDDGPVVGSLADAIKSWNTYAKETPDPVGIIAILDNATYDESLSSDDHRITIPANGKLAVVAAGWPLEAKDGGGHRRRKGRYDVLEPQGRRPHVSETIRVLGQADEKDEPGTLVIDGLLVEGKVSVVSTHDEPGNLGRLIVRHSTVGIGCREVDDDKMDVREGSLENGIQVTMDNTKLSIVLDHVVTGFVSAPSIAGGVRLVSSIVGDEDEAESDPESAALVLKAEFADVEIEACTVLGRVVARALSANDTIFTGTLGIARRQAGCVRYSLVPRGSRTPRRFECEPERAVARLRAARGGVLEADEEAAVRSRIWPQFSSGRPGDPQYLQLAPSCPREIREGAEGGAAMGAYRDLGEPFRDANLRDAFEEYLPIGLAAGVIFVT